MHSFVEGKRSMTQLPTNQHITYQLQYRKCGKAACGTCRDGHGHGPYWYAYWREGSRLRSGYIGKVQPATDHVSTISVATAPQEATAVLLINQRKF